MSSTVWSLLSLDVVFFAILFSFIVAVIFWGCVWRRPRQTMERDSTSANSSIDYEPRGDRVIVKRLPPPLPQEGEVFLPASQQKPLNEGVVVAVGPGLRNRLTGKIDPIDLEPDDRVCFVDYAGFPIEVDGEEYLSLREEEIHGRRT